MVESPVKEPTTEYVAKSEIDILMEKVITGLQPRIENAVQKAFEQHNNKYVTVATLDERIAAVKSEIETKLDNKLNTHMEQVRQQYQSDMEALRSQVASVGDETRNRLNEFNKLLDGATQTAELLNTKIEGWNNSLTANRQQYEDTRRDIERLENESDNVVKVQTGLAEKVSSLHRTIHGGEGDTPSVFSELKFIREQSEQTNRNVIAALEVAKDTAVRQDQYEKDLQEQRQRWVKRREMTQEFVSKLIGSKYFPWLAALAFLVLVAIFRPEALPALIEFVQKIFQSNP